MPHETLWEDKGVYWKMSGCVDLIEINQMNNRWYSDRRFLASEYCIWDASGIDRLAMSESQADIPAAHDRAAADMKPDLKAALIVGDAATRKLAEAFIASSKRLHSSWDFGLFDTEAQARAWVAFATEPACH